MKGFWLAWQFLTRLPAPVYRDVSDREIGASQAWYPLVGLLIGLLLYAADWALQQGPFSMTVVAILILLLWVGVTGALHLDGLADIADAWIGSQGDRQRALEIMKDSTSGPMGVTALILLLLLKFALLQQLLQQTGGALLLIFIPVLARVIVPLLFLSLPYLRPSGLGRALADHRPLVPMLVMTLALLGLGYLLNGWHILILGLVLLWSWLCLGLLFRHRFGGLTGDMVGAAIELSEVALLIGAIFLV
ncbi:MAG: adenosylcobinamide-GDP ribazoletransferase [Gammaproteobacteria bacterium]|nr:adenosylcobinamide-GDP ribazoletransferase [Gammaproteobacteria bacterium]